MMLVVLGMLVLACMVTIMIMIMITFYTRSSVVQGAVFSNKSLRVNVTNAVRRHMWSHNTLSMRDVVPEDMLDFDENPRLAVLLRRRSGEVVEYDLGRGEFLRRAPSGGRG